MQQEIAALEIEATSGGGMVKVVMDGQKNLKSLAIDPEVVSKDDVEMLQDLVMAAVNEAARKVDEAVQEKIGGLTGGHEDPGTASSRISAGRLIRGPGPIPARGKESLMRRLCSPAGRSCRRAGPPGRRVRAVPGHHRRHRRHGRRRERRARARRHRDAAQHGHELRARACRPTATAASAACCCPSDPTG